MVASASIVRLSTAFLFANSLALTAVSATHAAAQQPTPPIGARPASEGGDPAIRETLLPVPEAGTLVIPEAPGASPTPLTITTAAGIAPAGTPDPAPMATAIPGVERSYTAPEPGAERNLVLPVFNGDAGSASGNPALFKSLTPLRKAWFLREYQLARGDVSGAEKTLATLVELRLDSGIENATSISAALVRESRERIAAEKKAEAVAAAKAATALAPDHPAAWTGLARAQMSAGDWGGLFGSLQQAASATMRNLRARTRVLANASLALIAGALIAWVAFLLVSYLRHGRFLLHDFRHALADKMPVGLAALIFVPFLAFPLVFGLGVFALLAWLTIAVWIKLSTKERVVAALFLALGASAPAIAGRVAGLFAFEGGTAGRLFTAVREDELSARDIADLEADAARGEDPDVLLTIANAHLRAGRYGAAQGFYQRASDKGAGAAAAVGLGNVRYAVGDIASAIAQYEAALAQDGQDLAAHFNLYRIYNERTELDKATAKLSIAKALDARASDARIAGTLPLNRKLATEAGSGASLVSSAFVNRQMMVDAVPDQRLLARAFSKDEAGALARQSWRRVSPALTLGATSVMFVVALVIAGILTAGTKGAVPSRPCPKCGKALCIRCDGPPLEDDLCVQCYHAFLYTEGVDPRARAQKEREVRDYVDGKKKKRALLSILLPGAGHLLGGDTTRGAVLLVIAGIAVARLAGGRGWFRPAFPTGGQGWIAPLALSGIVLVVVWILGLRGHGDPVPEGRR